MIPDHINRPLKTELDLQAQEISDMATEISFFAVHMAKGFMLRINFSPPNGKTVRFRLHADERQRAELIEALEEALPDELKSEEGITFELADAILAIWYRRLQEANPSLKEV